MEPDLPLTLLLAAVCVTAASGLPGLFLGRSSSRGQSIATLATVVAALVGLAGAGLVLFQGSAPRIAFEWPIPGNEIALQADALSAFFLVPVLLMGALGSIYGQ